MKTFVRRVGHELGMATLLLAVIVFSTLAHANVIFVSDSGTLAALAHTQTFPRTRGARESSRSGCASAIGRAIPRHSQLII